MIYDHIRTYSSNLCKKKYPKFFFGIGQKKNRTCNFFLDKVNFRKIAHKIFFIQFRTFPRRYVVLKYVTANYMSIKSGKVLALSCPKPFKFCNAVYNAKFEPKILHDAMAARAKAQVYLKIKIL